LIANDTGGKTSHMLDNVSYLQSQDVIVPEKN
jgi:hypothetical protein